MALFFLIIIIGASSSRFAHSPHLTVAIVNDAGRNALWWARANGRADVVAQLCQSSAPVMSISTSTSTASSGINSKTIDTSNDNKQSKPTPTPPPKSSVNKPNKDDNDDGSSIDKMLSAVERNQIDRVRAALDAQAIDVNQANEFGNTLLIQAARKGHFDLVRMLVEEYNADVTRTNNAGRNALWWAKANNHIETSGYLYIKTD